MKVIFLDFDGVITTLLYKWRIDMTKVMLINHICERTDAKIIVSSSWRIGETTQSLQGSLRTYFKENLYLDHYNADFEKFVNNIIGRTDSEGSMRGEEIKRYIENNPEIENYVIIDDDSDMLDEQLFNFVQTDTYEGITQREVNFCINILNNVEIINPIRMNDELKFRWRLKCRYPDMDYVTEILENYKNKFKDN